MHYLPGVASAAFCLLSLALCTAGTKTEPKLDHDIVDTRKIYAAFPALLAIFDQDEDGDLDCVTAKRIEYDVEANTATYVWFLQGGNGHEKKNITYPLKPGPTPDVARYALDNDESKEYAVRFPATDYKNCLIAELPYNGSLECMLWVTDEVKDDLPQTCIDMFADNCDEGVSAYSQDMCQDEQDL